VIFEGALALSGDDDHLLNAGGGGLFDDVLDDRFIDDGEHLLGLGLGGRQEAGAQAGCRDHRFTNLHSRSPRRGCGRRCPTTVTSPSGELFLGGALRCSAP